MALLLEKTITNGNGQEITGSYWTVVGWQQVKGKKTLGVVCEMYQDENAFNNGDGALWTANFFSNDFEFDYSEIEQSGRSERAAVYDWIKENVPGFDLAVDV